MRMKLEEFWVKLGIFYRANRSTGTDRTYRENRIYKNQYIKNIETIDWGSGKCFSPFGKTLSWLDNGSSLPLLSLYDNVKIGWNCCEVKKCLYLCNRFRERNHEALCSFC